MSTIIAMHDEIAYRYLGQKIRYDDAKGYFIPSTLIRYKDSLLFKGHGYKGHAATNGTTPGWYPDGDWFTVEEEDIKSIPKKTISLEDEFGSSASLVEKLDKRYKLKGEK